MQKLSQKTQGIVYVLIAAFGFSLMSMFIKLAGDLPSFEKAFFRNFVALIFITILMLRSRTSFRPERRNLPALFGRCFFGTLGLLCNFYAIGKLNLPDANMLNKLSPFFRHPVFDLPAARKAEPCAGPWCAGRLRRQRVHHQAELR